MPFTNVMKRTGQISDSPKFTHNKFEYIYTYTRFVRIKTWLFKFLLDKSHGSTAFHHNRGGKNRIAGRAEGALQKSAYQDCFEDWKKRWYNCITSEGIKIDILMNKYMFFEKNNKSSFYSNKPRIFKLFIHDSYERSINQV